MRKIDTVFLDVDGVLADFDGGVSRWYELDRDFTSKRSYNYDYQKDFGMTDEDFWNGLTEDFWSGLAKFPWADELVEWLEGRFEVVLLTSPPRSGFGPSGKQLWIRENYPKILQERRYLIGPAKKYCARPSALLIDDHEGNTKPFKQRGGNTVLFPQPWNKNRRVLKDHHKVDAAMARLVYTYSQVTAVVRGTIIPERRTA